MYPRKSEVYRGQFRSPDNGRVDRVDAHARQKLKFKADRKQFDDCGPTICYHPIKAQGCATYLISQFGKSCFSCSNPCRVIAVPLIQSLRKDFIFAK